MNKAARARIMMHNCSEGIWSCDKDTENLQGCQQLDCRLMKRKLFSHFPATSLLSISPFVLLPYYPGSKMKMDRRSKVESVTVDKI